MAARGRARGPQPAGRGAGRGAGRDAGGHGNRGPGGAGRGGDARGRGGGGDPDTAALARAWPLYFSKEEGSFTPYDGRAKVILLFARFFRADGAFLVKVDLFGERVVHMNYGDLIEVCPLRDFAEALRDEPEDLLACLGLAMCVNRGTQYPALTPVRVIVRLQGVVPFTRMRRLKSNYVGKLVTVKGNVVRVGAIRPIVRRMEFVCGKCGTVIMAHFEDGKYEPPSKCNGHKCRSRALLPDRRSAVTVDWQKVRLQEMDLATQDAGRVPRTVDCELTEDMVDSCVPGDVMIITGIVKAVNVDLAAGKGAGRAKSLFSLYIDAVAVTNAKSGSAGQNVGAHLSTKELMAMQEIANSPNLFSLVVASLCPGIFGHEMVKAGLCLALFGGTQPTHTDKSRLSIRPDPHVLVVGDPGLGKSQLLQAVSALSPRGVYVCGNTTSTTGLTVTMVRDAVTGDYALEAGALVLGDQGICCIDEFDKMGAEHEALLEAMEQQCISIAKAGIVCNLSARTTVVAAANPVGGHYDRGKTVQENLKLSAPLLSRFDLLFILLDKPDDDRDEMLSRHVMAMHSHRRAVAQDDAEREAHAMSGSAHVRSGRFGHKRRRVVAKSITSSATPATAASQVERVPLGTRLQEEVAACTDPVPTILLKKYISYARQYCSPRLTLPAAKVLQEFYLSLRREHGSDDSTPITTRQLESLIRLSQARAKLELREEVTKDDAHDVVEIMKEALVEAYTDEFGVVDFSRAAGMSMAKQVKAFVSALNRMADQRGSATFSLAELRELVVRLRLQVPSVGDFVEVLNQQNYVLKKGNQTYQLQTSMYSQSGLGRRHARGGGSQGRFGRRGGGGFR